MRKAACKAAAAGAPLWRQLVPLRFGTDARPLWLLGACMPLE